MNSIIWITKLQIYFLVFFFVRATICFSRMVAASFPFIELFIGDLDAHTNSIMSCMYKYVVGTSRVHVRNCGNFHMRYKTKCNPNKFKRFPLSEVICFNIFNLFHFCAPTRDWRQKNSENKSRKDYSAFILNIISLFLPVDRWKKNSVFSLGYLHFRRA